MNGIVSGSAGAGQENLSLDSASSQASGLSGEHFIDLPPGIFRVPGAQEVGQRYAQGDVIVRRVGLLAENLLGLGHRSQALQLLHEGRIDELHTIRGQGHGLYIGVCRLTVLAVGGEDAALSEQQVGPGVVPEILFRCRF